MTYENYVSQLEPCPNCGEEDALGWCGISVRPFCNNCKEWGYVNHYPNGPEEAIRSWNQRSHESFKILEQQYEYKKLEKYNKELGIELTLSDLIDFHRAHCNLL